jgi:hypothetical protein
MVNKEITWDSPGLTRTQQVMLQASINLGKRLSLEMDTAVAIEKAIEAALQQESQRAVVAYKEQLELNNQIRQQYLKAENE